MKHFLRAAVLVANIPWLFAVSAHAQLAFWDVNGSSADLANPRAATGLGTHVSSASLTLGSGVTASGSVDTFGGSAFNTTSLASAISSGDYLSFTLTPAAGYTLDLTSISFNSGVSTATTNFNVALLSSATGFTSSASLYSYSFSTANAPFQTITLSSNSALQDVSGPVEFRLYGWRDASGTSTFRIRGLTGNDLVVNGAAMPAVPEPSTYGAIAGVLVLLAACWKRYRTPL